MRVNILFDLKHLQTIDVEIYSNIGQLVYNERINGKVGKNQISIPVNHLKIGMYIIKLDGQDFHAVQKLMVN